MVTTQLLIAIKSMDDLGEFKMWLKSCSETDVSEELEYALASIEEVGLCPLP